MINGNKKEHTLSGKLSIYVGILLICFLWITLIPPWCILYAFIHLPLGILTVVFGAVGYWRKEQHDNYGLIGFILGIIVVTAGFIFMNISMIFWYTP
jgi:hypothetical protein